MGEETPKDNVNQVGLFIMRLLASKLTSHDWQDEKVTVTYRGRKISQGFELRSIKLECASDVEVPADVQGAACGM